MKIKTLYIDRWKSECGDCGASVNPMALTCEPLSKMAPCDSRPYENVSSHYVGMADAVEPMRPDLYWVDPMDTRTSYSPLTGTE
jgi:hypothetical protein